MQVPMQIPGPPEEAFDMLDEKDVDEMMKENCREVVNSLNQTPELLDTRISELMTQYTQAQVNSQNLLMQ
eukprot:gene14028-4116_t